MAMASPFGLAPRAVTWESRTLTVIRRHARGQDAAGVAPEGFDHVVLERLEVGVLAQVVHPAHRSVQGMVHLPILCFPCFSWHAEQGINERPPPILAASPFPLPMN
jgi:hypothetical protein